MTFSLIGRCARTGQFGAAATTSSLAVGARVKPESNAAHAKDVVAIGNILSSGQVPRAMVEAFAAGPDLPLAERLVRGLEAGEEAGGEHGDVRSASLLVFGDHDFALVDLRVDGDATPIPRLRSLWEEYAPLVEPYVVRVVDPDNAIVL